MGRKNIVTILDLCHTFLLTIGILGILIGTFVSSQRDLIPNGIITCITSFVISGFSIIVEAAIKYLEKEKENEAYHG